MDSETVLSSIIGPFVGAITASSTKIWFQLAIPPNSAPKTIYVTIRESQVYSTNVQHGSATLSIETFGVGIVLVDGLNADSIYYYSLWHDDLFSIPVDLEGLEPEDLYFRTLPEQGYDKQLDFLLMSCHNPETAKDDGFSGFAVWRQIPQIMSQNKNVRFAILAGDQIYADEVESEVLNETDPAKRQQLYLGVYRKFWSNIYYRKVLCSLPAVLMWDDHDITDGWGSREDSFDGKSEGFDPKWSRMFDTAREIFTYMQAGRNPIPLQENFKPSFDFCFRIGRCGFLVPDLRSNRDIRKGRIWLPEQLEAIRNWVNANRKDLDTIFFVSSVVFSHGAPLIDNTILKYWFLVLDFVRWFRHTWPLKSLSKKFSDGVGDLRDDIDDSWGADRNAEETDRCLDFLFDIQNPADELSPVNVVILSGDIHTPGYSTLYSADEKHSKRAAIPHVVASPVAYKPFSWIGEAIYRHLTKTVALGRKGIYTSQISHHFCYRNVVLISQRNYEETESHLKVKYYLEGSPEPRVMLFDLNHGSRREAIEWSDLEVLRASHD